MPLRSALERERDAPAAADTARSPMVCQCAAKSFEKMGRQIARGLERVGEWWTILIVRDALHGMTRFDEFPQSLGATRLPSSSTRSS
jgi:hypothetical protein